MCCIFEQRNIQIASDGGRVCRPLVIADRGVSRVKEHHMKELKVNLPRSAPIDDA